jgi:hypothetical protein
VPNSHQRLKTAIPSSKQSKRERAAERESGGGQAVSWSSREQGDEAKEKSRGQGFRERERERECVCVCVCCSTEYGARGVSR